MKVAIPYGKKRLTFTLPRGRMLGVLQNRAAGQVAAGRLVAGALKRPLGRRSLTPAALAGKRVCLVVPDATRGAHLKEVLPVILKWIGPRAGTIDILVATGLHTPHTKRELRELLGAAVMKRCRVMSHAQGRGSLERFGATRRGVPVTLNKRLACYDRIISVGLVEPHLYAGYSGGVKTVAIGLAGKTTIDATHSVRFLDHAGTCIGSVAGNPFQETLWEIAAARPVDLCGNIVNDAAGRPVKAFAGPARDVFKAAVAFAKKIYEVTAPEKADTVICGVGHPKDVNFYQASRAVNYILSVDRPVLKKGGVLIVAAEMKDGIGTSATEKLFYDCMKHMRSPGAFMTAVRKHGCVAGEHRAYMVAKPLLDYTILFVSGRPAVWMKGLPIPFFRSVEDALAHADRITGKAGRAWVVPKALSTIAKARRG